MGYVIALAALYAAWRIVIAPRWFPYARCRRCKGRSRRGQPDAETWRYCRRCGGTGQRIRRLAPKRLRDKTR